MTTQKIRIFSGSGHASADAIDLLCPHFKIAADRFRDIERNSSFGDDILIFDLGDDHELALDAILSWRSGQTWKKNIVIFIATEEGRKALLRRGMLEGANFITRPLFERNLTALVLALSEKATHEIMASRSRITRDFPDQAPAILIGDSILDELMGSFESRSLFNVKMISEKANTLISTLGETGLNRWVGSVRMHHNATYQHCLLVTGTLLALGHHFKMNQSDLQRLAVGGLMHDLGKADVPLEILDKPSSLTPEEMEIIKIHPTTGMARARQAKEMTEELLQMIGFHHEYLDGSGYPNGLMNGSIPDPVRLLTIADIFSALIEFRPYKPPIKSGDALEIMRGMTGKIDMDFLTAVRPVLARVAA